ELLQCCLKLGLWQWRYRRQQIVRKLASDARADLRHIAHFGEPIKPCREAVLYDGIARAGSGPVSAYWSPWSLSSPNSTTAFVSSSTNNGTPSVLVTICSSTSLGRALPPMTLSASWVLSLRLRRLKITHVTCASPPQ